MPELAATLRSASQSLVTALDWIRLTASLLGRLLDHPETGQPAIALGQGCQTAWDEAHWLVVRGLSLDLEGPDAQLHGRLLPAEHQTLMALVHARLVDRQPTAYLLGEAWLAGYRFRADPRAIIPRSFLAERIVDLEDPVLPETADHILELCTGSGCLAILAADRWPESHLVAVDLSPDALSLARENGADHGLNDRIDWLTGSLYEPLPNRHPGFDLILANPPYVPSNKVLAFPPEFQAEPRMAHEGGADGMDLVRLIISGAQHHLNPAGLLLIEVGREFAACEAMLQDEFPDWDCLWLDAQTQPNALVALRRPT